MPAPPELLTPTSPAEAAAAFGDGAGVTVMGGGTILLPELTYGQLRPTRVLMIGRAGLSGVDNSNGVVRIGATTPVGELAGCPGAARHRREARGRPRDPRGRHDRRQPLRDRGRRRRRAAICRPRCSRSARASPRSGAGGEKTEDVEAFLEAGSGRLVLSIDVPGGQPFGYARLDRPHTHHYTMLAVTRRQGRRRRARRGLGRRRPLARRLHGVESALAGGASADDAAAHATEGLDLPTDALASAWYREQMLPLLVQRALGQLG